MKKQTTKLTVWTWEATGAVCCFVGGFGAALLGSVLTAMTWILGAQLHPWLRGWGTALLIVTIPLLILAGYCMDWLERDRSEPQGRSDAREREGILN